MKRRVYVLEVQQDGAWWPVMGWATRAAHRAYSRTYRANQDAHGRKLKYRTRVYVPNAARAAGGGR